MDEPAMPTTGALVWQLAMRWRSAVDRAVAPLGLTHAQYVALASLRGLTARGEKPSQRRLATWTGLGTIYVSKLVRTLERDGLIVRSPDPTDARAVQITLTERGRDTADRAIPIVRALDRELTAVLGGPGSDQVGALGDALRTLLQTAPQPGDEP
jgi:MarR family transcriptional regulator, organic hydroperoxide resistance regulator